ncbi:hypothetical protein OG809_35365 [Kribbella soli]
MNQRYAVLAASALAMGAVALGAPQASAEVNGPNHTVASPEPTWPDEGANYPGFEKKVPEYNYPRYELGGSVTPSPSTIRSQVSADDSGAEAVQAAASAVAGASLALGGSWLYRRRRVPVG